MYCFLKCLAEEIGFRPSLVLFVVVTISTVTFLTQASCLFHGGHRLLRLQGVSIYPFTSNIRSSGKSTACRWRIQLTRFEAPKLRLRPLVYAA